MNIPHTKVIDYVRSQIELGSSEAAIDSSFGWSKSTAVLTARRIHTPYPGPYLKQGESTQDLISGLTRIISGLDPLIGNALTDLIPDDAAAAWWLSSDSDALIDYAFRRLNDIAPRSHYFGSKPGNSRILGYWPLNP